MPDSLHWDIYCRVIDNHGDLGVCWRLARDLATRDQRVRLWIDDPRALAWMAPRGAAGVQVRHWQADTDVPGDPGDVVIEAFGCDPPPGMVQAMAARQPAPVWINLEYLSAETYVERSHGLPSPQPNGLRKWFFFPGFTSHTGGLLCEPGLMEQQAAFDGRSWLAAQGWAPQAGERVVSLFSYERPAAADWLAVLACQPTLVLASPGHASAQLCAWPPCPGLRVIELPWLSQPDYDRLLWSCDLNAVRGEDSFVRAQWAATPLLWQIYPQHDGVHATKLDAFIDRYLQPLAPGPAASVRQLMRHWNGLAPAPTLPLSVADWQAWQEGHLTWRKALAMQDDLCSQLQRFVQLRRGAAC